MASRSRKKGSTGPFHADQLRPGDRYELSDGHPVWCAPTGERGGNATRLGGQVIASDPAQPSVGIDVGYTPESGTLRAPDVSVTPGQDRPGWVRGVPPLAVEYADTGQDEAELQEKIRELLAAGTRWVWVVRLVGRVRVEVHAPDEPLRLLFPGMLLEAPGVLANPVPVEALVDRAAADRVTFANLLQREGYTSLEQVKQEGHKEGRKEGVDLGRLIALRQAVLAVLERRRLAISPAQSLHVSQADEPRLFALLEAAATAADADEVFGG